jgi:hypothetical protein
MTHWKTIDAQKTSLKEFFLTRVFTMSDEKESVYDTLLREISSTRYSLNNYITHCPFRNVSELKKQLDTSKESQKKRRQTLNKPLHRQARERVESTFAYKESRFVHARIILIRLFKKWATEMGSYRSRESSRRTVILSAQRSKYVLCCSSFRKVEIFHGLFNV